MLYYRVYDNSWCINVETGQHAFLVQKHDEWYSPDRKEDGALFKIVSKPYKEDVSDSVISYGVKDFVNVKSTRTGNVYRVLYSEHAIY